MARLKFITRKYYLNRKVKAFCTLKSRSRCVFITEAKESELTVLNKAYLAELINVYRYTKQYKLEL